MLAYMSLLAARSMQPSERDATRHILAVGDQPRIRTSLASRVAAQIAEVDAILFGPKEMPVWLPYLGETRERVALELGAFHEMQKVLGTRWVSIGDLCVRLKWSRASFDRRVCRGAWLIAEQLNKRGIE